MHRRGATTGAGSVSRKLTRAELRHSAPHDLDPFCSRFAGVTGIALLGVITAAIASWFVEKVSEVQAAEHRTNEQVAELANEVRLLRQELARGRRPS